MQRSLQWIAASIGVFAICATVGWLIFDRIQRIETPERTARPNRVPVLVQDIEVGPIELRRVFSGTLQAPAEFDVAPKIAGRVVKLHANLGDTVERGQVLAEFEDDEAQHAVAQAEAELALAQANLVGAESALNISEREFARMATLQERGVTTQSEFDISQADLLAKQARVDISKAEVARAEALLSAARVRLSYTQITATWSGDDNERIISHRYVNEGDTVAANTPLLAIVELNPLNAVIYVTERDYAHLKLGQPVTLEADAYQGEMFTGKVRRISPVFQQTSRQALVEISVKNARQLLKPGMYVQIHTVLEREEEATIVPVEALVKRDGQDCLFVLSEDRKRVSLRPIKVGIREGERAQVIGEQLEGEVVILGQQLLDDGSTVAISDNSFTSQLLPNTQLAKAAP